MASVVERAEVGDGWVVLTDPKPANAFIGELKKLKDDNLEALDPYVDWTSLLGPWGPVRQNDFADPRLLDPPWDDTCGSMVERGETKAFNYERRDAKKLVRTRALKVRHTLVGVEKEQKEDEEVYERVPPSTTSIMKHGFAGE